jgi:clan AA aspartic protease (TIGR02281 family)
MEIIPLTKTQSGHLELMGSINDVNAKFIVDTGATGTVIDINKLNIFGITTSQDKIEGLRIGDAETGKIETFPVDIEQFSIGQYQLNIKTIYTHDTSGKFADDVVGLIGHDALTELNALLDLKKLELLIPESQDDIRTMLGEKSTSIYQAIDLQQSSMGFSFVEIELGKHKARLLVDSGASETVLDESVLTQLGFKLQDHATAKTIIGQGIEVPMKVLSGKQITLGSVLISDEFFVTDFTALMKAINQDQQRVFVGILGNKQMVEMNTIIDVSNAKIYIKH